MTGHDNPSVSRRRRTAWLGPLAVGFVLACSRVFSSAAEAPGRSAPEQSGALPERPTQSVSLAVAAARLNPSPNQVNARVAEIQADLAEALVRARASETNLPAGMPAGDAAERRGLLFRLARIYEQQLSNLAELETAKARRALANQQAQNWSQFAEPRPYSIVLSDGLRESIQAEKVRIAADKQALVSLEELVAENRATLARAEEKIRWINERLEGVAPSASAGILVWQRELEQIRSRVARAAVQLFELERQIREENLAASHIHLELLERQVVVAKADTQFTQADLDKMLLGLEVDRIRLERELAEAEQRQNTALAALEGARQWTPPTRDAGPATAADVMRANEQIELRAAQWDSAVTAVRVLRLQLEALSVERTLWERRFATYRSRESENLRQSERQLQTLAKRAALWKDYFHQKLDTSSSQVELAQSRLNTLDLNSELAPLLRERLSALRERDQWLLSIVRWTDRLERLLQRWNEDLERDKARLPFADRVHNLFSSTRSFVHNLWTFELFTAEDTITVDGQKISGRRSVTVGKVAGAVFILVIGYWLIGLASRTGSRFVEKWLQVEHNQSELIRRWLRAVLLVFLILFSLVSVKIPLTVFAFAGGALAIAIGFGTQTILKNVVSGLIILFEQPFRVGDTLDVAGQKGTLTSIGLRASVLQLWDGTEALFPNSNLLENPLTNWTYSNPVVRFTLVVGVAYGSDTRRTVQLLDEVVGRHGQIERNPKPQVFLAEFGPSALTFEVRFWLDVRKTNSAQVSSDLRQMIAGAFSEHKIVIAFPQHDVHLNLTGPLPVEVVTTPDPLPHRQNGPEPTGERSKV